MCAMPLLLTLKELLLLEDKFKHAQWRKGDCIEDALGEFLRRVGSALIHAVADNEAGITGTYAVGITEIEAWQAIDKVGVFDTVGNDAVGQRLLVKLYRVVVKPGDGCPYEVREPLVVEGEGVSDARHEDHHADADGAGHGAEATAESRRAVPSAERPDGARSAEDTEITPADCERWYEGYE